MAEERRRRRSGTGGAEEFFVEGWPNDNAAEFLISRPHRIVCFVPAEDKKAMPAPSEDVTARYRTAEPTDGTRWSLAGHAAAEKHVEVEHSWHKLAAQWKRLARGPDATGQQAQQPQTKKRS